MHAKIQGINNMEMAMSVILTEASNISGTFIIVTVFPYSEFSLYLKLL